jgi:NAD(P)-dependent dehydrogenase (short-subunit alcohol dehydrogenase family)
LRLQLDTHLSGRAIGRALRKAGHKVLALDEHRELEGLDDWTLLELAAEEERILVTSNIQDFPDLLQQWAEEGRSHAGCILLVGLAQNEFGLILRRLTAAMAARPLVSQWQDLTLFLGRN